MESKEEQFIRVFLSRKKPKEPRNSDRLISKIGKKIGSGGGLFSMGSHRSFVRNNRRFDRRVIVKALILKNDGQNWAERRQKHANYIQRESVGKEGDRGVAYGSEIDEIEVSDFLKRGSEDAHEFRFILSPEDASQLDLTKFTRSVMKSLENDLKTKLDWIAANHYNTDSPHTHIVLRGADDNGNKLILDRDTISNGIRNRARKIVTRELGERTLWEIKKEIKLSVEKKRAVPLDFEIEKRLGVDRLYTLQTNVELQGFEVSTKQQKQRLQFLETIGFSESINQTTWKIQPEFIDRLKEISIQGDIIKMMHREIDVQEQSCVVYKPEIHGQKELTGVVKKRGVSDEMTDREFLVIQAPDKKYYYVDLDRYSDKSRARVGDPVVISMTEPKSWIKKSDLNLLAFAKKDQDIYDSNKHGKWAKSVGVSHPDYVKVHVTRIEFLETLELATKCGVGQWKLKPDFLEDLKKFEDEQKQKFTPRVSVRVPSMEQKQSLKQGLEGPARVR